MITNTIEENIIVQDNVNYVLGMYDLYKNDQEIVNMLKLKGIELRLIQVILHKVRLPAYEKRIKQGRRSIIIGAIIIGLFFILPFSLAYLFKVDFSGSNSLQNGTKPGEEALQFVLHRYVELYLVIIGIGVVGILSGIFSISKYKKLIHSVT